MSSFLRCGWQWTSSWYELLASTAVPVSPRAQAQKTQVYIKVTHEGVPPGAPLSPRPAPHGKHHDGSEGGEGGHVSAKNPLSLLGASGHKSPPVLPAVGEGGGGGGYSSSKSQVQVQEVDIEQQRQSCWPCSVRSTNTHVLRQTTDIIYFSVTAPPCAALHVLLVGEHEEGGNVGGGAQETQPEVYR